MRHLRSVTFCALLAVVAGCVTYSPRTVNDLKALQSAMESLYGTFRGDIDPVAVEAVRARLGALRALEEGRGRGNRIMVAQVKNIGRLFDLQVKQRQEAGPWSEAMVRESIANFREATNSAIHIEETHR